MGITNMPVTFGRLEFLLGNCTHRSQMDKMGETSRFPSTILKTMR